MASDFKVTIYEPKVSLLFDAPGQVGQWASARQREIVGQAKVEAPVRYGELVMGIRAGGALKTGRYSLRRIILSTAGHSRFVHEGTHGPIFARRYGHMMVPAFQGAAPGRKGGTNLVARRSVAGQSANPFLVRAGRLVMLRHGVV